MSEHDEAVKKAREVVIGLWASYITRAEAAEQERDEAVAARRKFQERYGMVMADRDDALRRLAAVEALRDEWAERAEHYRGTGNYQAQADALHELRAALATGGDR